MAEKIQDAEDRLLDAMFQADPIADDGFSDRVVRRIRRQIWVRRLALPIAMVVGAAIAVKPAAQLLSIGSQVFDSIGTESLLPQSTLVAQLPVILIGGLALALVMATFRLFEE
jgi:hypothetical protein